jgi:hypothetical protein
MFNLYNIKVKEERQFCNHPVFNLHGISTVLLLHCPNVKILLNVGNIKRHASQDCSSGYVQFHCRDK